MLIKRTQRPPSRAAPAVVAALAAALLIGLGTQLPDVAGGLAELDDLARDTRELLGSSAQPAPDARAEPVGEIDRVYLRIQWEDLAKLKRKRAEALRLGVLMSAPDDLVPLHLALNDTDRLVKGKVRLKGDWSEHVKGHQWSMRVKLSGDGRLYGMKTFSLQRPRHRNGIHGWLYHQAMRREGIVALRYRFVHLYLNQTDLGIYAIEEHFDHRMLEDNGFREGPILRFDESLIWRLKAEKDLSPPTVNLRILADIKPYSSPRVLADDHHRKEFLRAASLLEGARTGELPLADVFDVGKTARYYALSDLAGARHGIRWANQRFYFNPVTTRLEPIAFDANAGERIRETAFGTGDGLELLWRHPGFRRAYFAELERLCEPAYLETFFEEIGADLARSVAILASDPEGLPAGGSADDARDVYRSNQAAIRKYLRPLRALRVHLAPTASDHIRIEAVSLSRLPLEVVGLARPGAAMLRPSAPVELAPYTPGPVRVEPIVFYPAPGEHQAWRNPVDAELRFKIAGTRAIMSEGLLPWRAPRSDLVVPDLMHGRKDLAPRPFLAEPTTDRVAGDRVRILPGTWQLDRDLVIPPGRKLVCGPGVTLDLVAGASILSYSALELRGLPEQPIVIRSSDRTGHGVLVLNAGEESILEHVHFIDLAAPRGEGWAMTGAVTFYQSPVKISGGVFAHNRASDDALNIVRSALRIDTTHFHDTASDAIDIDFGTGEIRGSRFERILGDAVDVSGSELKLAQLTFLEIGDKAVSAGEESRVRFVDLDIEDARMGLVSKDDSTLEGKTLVLRGGEVGFAVFRKKPEFGGASMAVYGYVVEDVATLYLLEPGSRLVLESRQMPVNAENLEEKLYPADESR